jgi:hypothetical protein
MDSRKTTVTGQDETTFEASNATGSTAIKVHGVSILTTHNLAVLFRAFELGRELQGDLRGMAERCFRWICRRQQDRTDQWHARLIMLKNTAYAWRQMIFYLSFLAGADVTQFLEWAQNHLLQQRSDFQTRFSPALRGLVSVHAGASGRTDGGIVPFLGWTQTQH